MTSRRDFLRKTTIALAGGLIVGDQAMELFERLTHQRKSFPSAAVPWNGRHVYFYPEQHAIVAMIPDGGYECTSTVTASVLWTGPGSVNWESLGYSRDREKLCMTIGQRDGYVEG